MGRKVEVSTAAQLKEMFIKHILLPESERGKINFKKVLPMVLGELMTAEDLEDWTVIEFVLMITNANLDSKWGKKNRNKLPKEVNELLSGINDPLGLLIGAIREEMGDQISRMLH